MLNTAGSQTRPSALHPLDPGCPSELPSRPSVPLCEATGSSPRGPCVRPSAPCTRSSVRLKWHVATWSEETEAAEVEKFVLEFERSCLGARPVSLGRPPTRQAVGLASQGPPFLSSFPCLHHHAKRETVSGPRRALRPEHPDPEVFVLEQVLSALEEPPFARCVADRSRHFCGCSRPAVSGLVLLNVFCRGL